MPKSHIGNLIIIGLFIFFFLLVSRVLLPPDNTPPSNYHMGLVLSATPEQNKKSLQLRQLPIITTTPIPSDTSSTPITVNCTVPANIASNLPALIQVVKTNYGIILSGDALTIAKARVTYESMCLAFQSPAFQKNLNSLQHPIGIAFINNGTCFAWTFNTVRSELWEPCSDIVDKYIIIHELTHQMQMGGAFGRNAHWLAWQSVWSTERNHRIPTGPCMIEERGDGGECEADAVAEYMYYKTYRNSWGGRPSGGPNLADYPTTWPKWYAFARDNIFGGVTY